MTANMLGMKPCLRVINCTECDDTIRGFAIDDAIAGCGGTVWTPGGGLVACFKRDAADLAAMGGAEAGSHG